MPDFRFAPLLASDVPLLHGWLRRPHVAQWWDPTPTQQELHADYFGPGADPAQACIAWLGDEAIGFIQAYVAIASSGGWWPDETDPGVRGIDQFLADGTRLGQGLGRAMVNAFVAQLFADAAVTAVQTDPQPDNERAIRCYRAAGFRDVGLVATPDGPAWLMRVRRDQWRGGPSRREGFPARGGVDFGHSASS